MSDSTGRHESAFTNPETYLVAALAPGFVRGTVIGRYDGNYYPTPPPRFVAKDLYTGKEVRKPWPLQGRPASWCFGATTSELYVEDEGQIYRFDLRSGQMTSLGGGYAPIWYRGHLAYIRPNGRDVVITSGDQSRVLRSPGPKLKTLEWSPSGRYLIFKHLIGFAGIGSLGGAGWGVGIIEIASGDSWAIVPGTYSGVTIERVVGKYGMQWVERLPPGVSYLAP